MTKRAGVFSGSFDPVHAGHIDLALQAILTVGLDSVYFVPEFEPRYKQAVAHFAHRIEMLKLACLPHPKLKVLELPDKQFTHLATTRRIKKLLPDARLYFICGADMLEHMPSWPHVDRFLKDFELIIGLRGNYTKSKVNVLINKLPVKISPKIIETLNRDVSSRELKQALIGSDDYRGLLPSTAEYISKNNLYN